MVVAGDRDAVEAIPLRLMIVAVVAGLSVVPASDALHALEDRSFLDRCVLLLDRIIATSQVVSLEGIGAKRTIELDMRSDGSLRADTLRIGGCWMDPFMSSAVLKLTSGRTIVRQASEPPVWLASGSHEALLTHPGLVRLSLEASEHEGRRLVVCEVVNWTS